VKRKGKKEKNRQQIVVEEKYQEPLRALLIGEGQTNIQRLLDTPGNTSWKSGSRQQNARWIG
jgi:hypothetical protein